MEGQELFVNTNALKEALENAVLRPGMDVMYAKVTPNRIISSGPATIFFWEDGTKTIVKCAKDATPSVYTAFTAAVAIKIFGSNSAVKKIIERTLTVQEVKKKEPEQKKTVVKNPAVGKHPTEIPVKTVKKKQSTIDHGKICALYKAGWNPTKIADECKCTVQTVINHLQKEGIYKNATISTSKESTGTDK